MRSTKAELARKKLIDGKKVMLLRDVENKRGDKFKAGTWGRATCRRGARGTEFWTDVRVRTGGWERLGIRGLSPFDVEPVHEEEP